MSAIRYVYKEGEFDGWDMPLAIGWYFYGEDDGATMYGPYTTKELCENAFIRFVDDLNKGYDNAIS